MFVLTNRWRFHSVKKIKSKQKKKWRQKRGEKTPKQFNQNRSFSIQREKKIRRSAKYKKRKYLHFFVSILKCILLSFYFPFCFVSHYRFHPIWVLRTGINSLSKNNEGKQFDFHILKLKNCLRSRWKSNAILFSTKLLFEGGNDFFFFFHWDLNKMIALEVIFHGFNSFWVRKKENRMILQGSEVATLPSEHLFLFFLWSMRYEATFRQRRFEKIGEKKNNSKSDFNWAHIVTDKWNTLFAVMLTTIFRSFVCVHSFFSNWLVIIFWDKWRLIMVF